MSPNWTAALIGALIGAAALVGIQGSYFDPFDLILSALVGALLAVPAYRAATGAMSPIGQAALFGSLIGAAFQIQDFIAAPSYVEFGRLVGAAAIAALLVAIAHRVIIGKRKPKI